MKPGGAIGVGGAALVALSLVLTPALAASTENRLAKPRQVLLIRPGGFTPAISDPRLAAELSRRGLQANSFRLTPATIALGGNKAVRIAIRARAATADAALRHASTPSALPVTAITPTVYNLGVSLGWKRFALSGDIDRIRGGTLPGGREAAELGVSYSMSRFTARAEVGAARADPDTPRLLAEDSSYTVGVGGSYRLARNLDVTGGVRYKIQHDRLEPLTDQRRDSQAVYIGTAFRF
ncbi:MAG: hypothetical protein QOH81_1253 [Sphingomonadales bacterium]|jgi:hypothetical protein|nr:hypothetical protein [Sphingomonadales bacterium]